MVELRILIEYEIFNSEKGTTKVAMSKLWPVYYVSGIQIYFLSTRQILQFRLRVEDDKMSGMVHTGVEVHRMDTEISRLVECPWLQLMCYTVCLPHGCNFK